MSQCNADWLVDFQPNKGPDDHPLIDVLKQVRPDRLVHLSLPQRHAALALDATPGVLFHTLWRFTQLRYLDLGGQIEMEGDDSWLVRNTNDEIWCLDPLKYLNTLVIARIK